MRNKILILHDAEASSKELGQKISIHLGERWDLEPMIFGMDFSRWGRLKKTAWDFLQEDWAGLIAIKKFVQSKLLASDESEVLAQLRRTQPPMVIATSESAIRIMLAIKNKNFYLGSVIAALASFSYSDFTQDNIDVFVCMNKFQQDSLRAAGVSTDKIANVTLLAQTNIPPVFDSDLRELGLLSTMPSVFFYSTGSSAAIESFRRLLRAGGSFQILLCAPLSALEAFKSISAPAAHPVKLITNSEKIGEYVGASTAVIADYPSYNVIELAALNKKPVIFIDSLNNGLGMAKFVSEGLAVFARVPTETQFFVEIAISGKKITDTAKMFAYLTNSEANLNLADGLDAVIPAHELRVSNYQEKES